MPAAAVERQPRAFSFVAPRPMEMTSSAKTNVTGGCIAAVALALFSSACARPADASTSTSAAATAPRAMYARTPGLSLSADVGKKLFFDKSLSATGAMSCATC
ncbi:MAG TPA: cytochrome c peroxidase, partial [Polyangia bacterium]|nr:cytochrome c peroxidase [Polyangia bacterium]